MFYLQPLATLFPGLFKCSVRCGDAPVDSFLAHIRLGVESAYVAAQNDRGPRVGEDVALSPGSFTLDALEIGDNHVALGKIVRPLHEPRKLD
jgi:hypothetical protein